VEHPAHIFTCNTRHCRKIRLRDLLSNHSAPLADLSAERVSKT
jgi:hypothetical protein